MQNKTRQDRNLSATIYLGKLRLLEKKVREYWFCLFKKLPKVLLKLKKNISLWWSSVLKKNSKIENKFCLTYSLFDKTHGRNYLTRALSRYVNFAKIRSTGAHTDLYVATQRATVATAMEKIGTGGQGISYCAHIRDLHKHWQCSLSGLRVHAK